MSQGAAPPAPASPGLLDRTLRLFGDVKDGEGATVFLLLSNVFLILAGYYICKTVREPLILASGGAEAKSYAAAGQALALMGFVPLYSWFAARVDRRSLIRGVTLFFVLNLEMFWLGAQAKVPYLGVAFFIWVGIFNNAVIAQFWSFANDLYSPAAGQRLFPLIAIGSTLGSPLGAKAAELLFKGGVHAYSMLHITAGVLLVSLLLYSGVEHRLPPRSANDARLDSGPGGFALIARSPYLRLVCLLLLLLNLVNTTGEYILGQAVVSHAQSLAAASPGFDSEAYIGGFYGGYLFYVNVVTVAIQVLLTSRIVKYMGLAGALLALPVVALGAYGSVLLGAGFMAIRWAKTAENATDYSVMNTARQLIWLPTSRDEKYKAKQATDTFVVRAGDVLSAALVGLGIHWLGLNATGFAAANLLLVGLWIMVAVLLLREYRALTARRMAELAA